MKISNTKRFNSWMIAAAVLAWAATFTPAGCLGQVTKSGEPASAAKSPPPQSTDTPVPSVKPEGTGERPINEQPPLKALPTDAAAKRSDANAKDAGPAVKAVQPGDKTIRTTPGVGDTTPDVPPTKATSLPAGKSQP